MSKKNVASAPADLVALKACALASSIIVLDIDFISLAQLVFGRPIRDFLPVRPGEILHQKFGLTPERKES